MHMHSQCSICNCENVPYPICFPGLHDLFTSLLLIEYKLCLCWVNESAMVDISCEIVWNISKISGKFFLVCGFEHLFLCKYLR